MNQLDLYAPSMTVSPHPVAGRCLTAAPAGAPLYPRSRASDPRSSHDAAAQADKFGGFQASQVLAAIRNWPMSTTHELAEATRLDRYAVARRAPELARQGLIRRIDPTDHTVPCRVSGKRVCRWEAVL